MEVYIVTVYKLMAPTGERHQSQKSCLSSFAETWKRLQPSTNHSCVAFYGFKESWPFDHTIRFFPNAHLQVDSRPPTNIIYSSDSCFEDILANHAAS